MRPDHPRHLDPAEIEHHRSKVSAKTKGRGILVRRDLLGDDETGADG